MSTPQFRNPNRVCLHCGVPCYRRPSAIRAFCSQKCKDDHDTPNVGEDLRRCSRCKEVRSKSDFNTRDHRLQSWCRPCMTEYDRKRYTNPLKREDVRRHAAKAQMECKNWLAEYKKNKPCCDCGGIFHPWAMHFDHLPGHTKENEVGQMVRYCSIKKMQAEIAKCELVCANCHAVRTYNRSQNASRE